MLPTLTFDNELVRIDTYFKELDRQTSMRGSAEVASCLLAGNIAWW